MYVRVFVGIRKCVPNSSYRRVFIWYHFLLQNQGQNILTVQTEKKGLWKVNKNMYLEFPRHKSYLHLKISVGGYFS